MLSSSRNEMVTRIELKNLSAQLTCTVKSLEFVKKICQGTSAGNSNPIHRLEVCGVILQNKIDDLNTMVKKLNNLNKKAGGCLPNSDKAA
jgi:hypothetical protein